MFQPSIKDNHSLVNVDMVGTTSLFMIAMVGILLAIAMSVCCYTC